MGDKDVIWDFSLFYNDPFNFFFFFFFFFEQFMSLNKIYALVLPLMDRGWYHSWMSLMIFGIALIRHSRYKIR